MKTTQNQSLRIIQGDCIDILKKAPAESIDLVVTDPPYIVNFVDRSGRRIANDQHSSWLKPAFRQIYRVLKKDAYMVCFYGWNHIEKFMIAWKNVGFRPVGHIVFSKKYPSAVNYMGHRHECAFLLVKGCPEKPARKLKDVLPWKYTGNKWHPTQKPIEAIRPLISAFSKSGDIVLDPFAGSGTTGVAAAQIKRKFIGIEKDIEYAQNAKRRLCLIR